MKTRINVNLHHEAERIFKHVLPVGSLLATQGKLKPSNNEGMKILGTSAPNNGMYQCSPLLDLSKLLQGDLFPDNFFSGKTGIDLGSGLGGAVFLLHNFIHMHGCEFDKVLWEASISIQESLGANYRDIRFINTDFLELNLRSYGLVYFYEPFADNFALLMLEKLSSVDSGTVIIFPKLSNPEFRLTAFPRKSFNEIMNPYNSGIERCIFNVFQRV